MPSKVSSTLIVMYVSFMTTGKKLEHQFIKNITFCTAVALSIFFCLFKYHQGSDNEEMILISISLKADHIMYLNQNIKFESATLPPASI